MSHHLPRALCAVLATLALTLALPVPGAAVAMAQTDAGAGEAMECGADCPMMAAARRAASHHRASAPAPCRRGDGFNCCASAPQHPVVPPGEATTTAPVTVPEPPPTPAATLPPPAPRSTSFGTDSDAPDPPDAPLFLLHGSFLS
jgi:hypothetical protein